MPNFIKIRSNFSVGSKFARIYNFGSRSSALSTIFKLAISIKLEDIAILRPNLPNFRSRSAIFKYYLEGIDTCFNVEGVLLERNFGGYCFFLSGWLLLVTCCLLAVTARYCIFPLLVSSSHKNRGLTEINHIN